MASQMGNGNKDRFQMSREDKDKLRDHRLFMINNVLPSETLLSYLLQKRVLSEDHYEEINVSIIKEFGNCSIVTYLIVCLIVNIGFA